MTRPINSAERGCLLLKNKPNHSAMKRGLKIQIKTKAQMMNRPKIRAAVVPQNTPTLKEMSKVAMGKPRKSKPTMKPTHALRRVKLEMVKMGR